MSEIEKLMQNAEVKKLLYCDICKAQEYALGLCAETKCEPFYPPFTAEKQLELIKWLILNDFIDELDMFYRPLEEMWVFQIYNVTEFANEKSVCRMGADMTFEEGLAYLLNSIWQDLSDTEKAEIKRILE